MNRPKVKENSLIDRYGLIAHPEGGYFKEIYRSETIVSSPVHGQKRNSATHIYFLLQKEDISRFHKVIHDEIWNFYEGAPLRLIRFDGQKVIEETIGPRCHDYASVIKGGCYQAAESTGAYSLVGCTVAPGFDFADFSFLKDSPNHLERFMPFHDAYVKFI